MTAGELCSRTVVFAERDMGLVEAARPMRERGVRRVPVTDAQGALVGILAADDVLEAVADQLGDLARAITSGRAHEARARR